MEVLKIKLDSVLAKIKDLQYDILKLKYQVEYINKMVKELDEDETKHRA